MLSAIGEHKRGRVHIRTGHHAGRTLLVDFWLRADPMRYEVQAHLHGSPQRVAATTIPMRTDFTQADESKRVWDLLREGLPDLLAAIDASRGDRLIRDPVYRKDRTILTHGRN